MQKIRIAIVHHDRLYRESMGLYLAQHEELMVTYCYASLTTAHEKVIAFRPDVILLDFAVSRSADDRKILERFDTRVKRIVVGVPDTEEDILSCIEETGAAGCVLTEESLEELINHIHAVVNGKTLCSPRIVNLAFRRMSALARRPAPVGSQDGTCLTKREAEIASLIDEGLSNKEIALRLHIEVSTVKNHVHNILDKLQIHNRHSAAKYLKAQHLPAGSHF